MHCIELLIVVEAPSTVVENNGTVTVVIRAVGGLQRAVNLK